VNGAVGGVITVVFFAVWNALYGRKHLGKIQGAAQMLTVFASALVATPLIVKSAQAALESVPRELEDVGRSLGLASFELLVRVSLPLAWRGVVAGLAMGFARAAGEFGATLMFAGDIPGRTNTMPIEIFEAYRAGQDARALAYVGVLTVMSIIVVVLAARMSGESPHRSSFER